MLLSRESYQPGYCVLIREMVLSYQFSFRRILSYQFKIQLIMSQESQNFADLRSQL